MKLTSQCISTLVLVCSFAAPVFAQDSVLTAAVAAPTRTPANVARDPARHPYETLSFFGVKPTMTVVELVPEGGWYTEILAPYLRGKGTLIGAGDPLTQDDEGFYTRMFKKLLDSNPAVYDKVKMGVFQPSKKKFDFAKESSVDMVLTFRNVHNWVKKGDEDVRAAMKAVYASLKSGGVFGVVDHRLPAGMRQAPDARGGYVHEAYVIRLAEEAGFKLAAKSEVNANPKDIADYHNGVWSLPPTFANGNHNRTRYAEIGESDRMTLRFVKP